MEVEIQERDRISPERLLPAVVSLTNGRFKKKITVLVRLEIPPSLRSRALGMGFIGYVEV